MARVFVRQLDPGQVPRREEMLLGMAALVAAGGTLLYLHGSTPCDGPSSECENTYDTSTARLVLVGAGSAALGISMYLFVSEAESAPARVSSARGSQTAWIAGVGQRW